MTINFPKIVASLRPDEPLPSLDPNRILIIGQVGIASLGYLTTEDVQESAIDSTFGANTLLSKGLKIIKGINPKSIIDTFTIDTSSAVAGAIALTFTGTATADGTFDIVLGSSSSERYTISILSGQTATSVAAAINTAINTNIKSVFTSSVATATVTVTHRDKGTIGNKTGIWFEGSVPGINFPAFTTISSGASDPSVSAAILKQALDFKRYKTVLIMSEFLLTNTMAGVDDKFNTDEGVEDQVAVFVDQDTIANTIALAGGFNSQNLVIFNDKYSSIANTFFNVPVSQEFGFFVACEFVAIRSLRFEDGANLSNYVISRSTGDTFGGPHTASKPYANTSSSLMKITKAMFPPLAPLYLTKEQQISLQAAGVSYFGPNRARTGIIYGPVFTTYLTDAVGNTDLTYKYLNYRDTTSICREYIVNATRSKFVQYRAVGGQLAAGYDSANEASVAAFVVEKKDELADLALLNTGVGTVGGAQVDYDKLFRENLTVVLNPSTGRFTIGLNLYPVVQFREALYDMAITFEV